MNSKDLKLLIKETIREFQSSMLKEEVEMGQAKGTVVVNGEEYEYVADVELSVDRSMEPHGEETSDINVVGISDVVLTPEVQDNILRREVLKAVVKDIKYSEDPWSFLGA